MPNSEKFLEVLFGRLVILDEISFSRPNCFLLYLLYFLLEVSYLLTVIFNEFGCQSRKISV